MIQCYVQGSVFITLLLTHCYSVLAILEKRIYTDGVVKRSYFRLEDFLWTGSGDGYEEEITLPTEGDSWYTTTVFQTTTIFSTVAYETNVPYESNTDCPDNECKIEATPTFFPASITPQEPWTPKPMYNESILDPEYWLITIFRVHNNSVVLKTPELEKHLAKLYKIAFYREQQQHLGFNKLLNSSNIRSQQFLTRIRREDRNSVTVRIHNVSIDGLVQVIYTVRVAGQPVLATAAARDMKLVSEAEVVAEIGYPIITKAEPYLKPSKHLPSSYSSKTDLWILVSAVSFFVVLVLLVFIFLLTSKKRSKNSRTREGSLNRRRDIVRQISQEGMQKMSTSVEDIPHHSKRDEISQTENGNIHHYESQEGSSARLRVHTHKLSSTNSYLSMPSVKDFPSGEPLPEPLTTVLDASNATAKRVTRHDSLEDGDPGIVGPIVWDLHRHRTRSVKSDEDTLSNDACLEPDIGWMRRRFNELLDDAFSTLGSRRSSPSASTTTLPDQRTQSARPRDNEDYTRDIPARPQTSINQRRISFPAPKGAWQDSRSETPGRLYSRPLSAGPFHRPSVHPEVILTDAELPPHDPALPLIAAIKEELEKFPRKHK